VQFLQAMKTKLQKYLIVTLLALGVLPFTYAQVGINITDPNGGALLDISSREKGILIPRINITDLTTIAPISGLISFAEEMAAESLLVYNINDTTGRGFHYWDGTTWISLGDKNLGKDDLIQSEESRTYDMNGEDLNFTNGAFGINTPNPNGAIEATSTENYNAYTFTQDNSLTGEKDVFTIEDQDAGGGAQDHSSVLKVLKSGNINSGDNGFSLIELANTGSDPGANKYWISGRKIDESAALWGIDITDNDFWSKGGLTLGITENTNGTYSSGTFRVDEDGDTSIGTVGAVASAKLELTAADKGFLTTRVSLVATDDATNPINAPATGLLVYNTATAGTGSTAVAPGFYYWDSSRWVALDGTNGKDWSLLGNIGTNPATNYLGTIDNADLVIRTNATERMRVDGTDGNIGVNVTPNTAARLAVTSTGTENAINANISNAAGLAILATNTATNGIGIIASGNNSGTAAFAGVGGNFNGSRTGAIGIGATTDGNGLGGVGNNGVQLISPSDGAGIVGNGEFTGVYGIATGTSGIRQAGSFRLNKSGSANDTPGDDPIAILAGYDGSDYFGGYFDGNQDNFDSGFIPGDDQDYAYVAMKVGNTNFKIIGGGSVSTLVNDDEGNKRVLFAPEAPEILFEDYGTGKLVNGKATITLDPLLSKSIFVSDKFPLKVFIQLEGDCNGVFVTNKSQTGFTVIELNNGNSNVPFSWHIVANRADSLNSNGEVSSKHVGVRFPIGPQPLKPTRTTSQSHSKEHKN